MLRFTKKPDEVLTEIISNALEIAIGHIDLDIKFNNEDGLTFVYFDEKFVNSFGGARDGIPIILNELKKLMQAHLSSDVYMPTDIHFKMLDRVLRTYCDLYNDEFHVSAEDAIKCSGEIIQRLSFDEIQDLFFWDMDYDLDEKTAQALFNNKQLREYLDLSISIQALNTVLGIPVDFSDLKLEKWVEPNWSESEDYSDFWLGRDEDMECELE